tara:strand:- start:388 stop:762 length:375 start_codon:yes stop_codon:yes gene_type:complete
LPWAHLPVENSSFLSQTLTLLGIIPAQKATKPAWVAARKREMRAIHLNKNELKRTFKLFSSFMVWFAIKSSSLKLRWFESHLSSVEDFSQVWVLRGWALFFSESAGILTASAELLNPHFQKGFQ